jgi:hypothetical protein
VALGRPGTRQNVKPLGHTNFSTSLNYKLVDNIDMFSPKNMKSGKEAICNKFEVQH